MKLKKIALAMVALILMLNLTSCGLVANILMNNTEYVSVEETVDITYDELPDYISSQGTVPTILPQKKISMNVRLNGKFTTLDALDGLMGGETVLLSLNCMVMIANRNERAQSMGISDAIEYAEYNRSSVDSHSSVLLDENANGAYYEYSTNLLGKELTGLAYFYEDNGNIWTLDMVCDPDDYEDMRSYFFDWAQSVEFYCEYLPQ